jgi:hypothetical protein
MADFMWGQSRESFTLKYKGTKHAVVLFEGDTPEPPFYDDCREAGAVVAMAGGGMVVSKVVYESEWVIHEPHPA